MYDFQQITNKNYFIYVFIYLHTYHLHQSNSYKESKILFHFVTDLPIIGQSPCSAHASLKLLIQRIIQEAIGLPTLQKAQEHPGAPAENTDRTYEDLLATAILNKVRFTTFF